MCLNTATRWCDYDRWDLPQSKWFFRFAPLHIYGTRHCERIWQEIHSRCRFAASSPYYLRSKHCACLLLLAGDLFVTASLFSAVVLVTLR